MQVHAVASGLRRKLAPSLLVAFAVACYRAPRPMPLPKTLGEVNSGFGYVPLDGLPVAVVADTVSCQSDHDRKAVVQTWPTHLLEFLPDLSVRFAVATLTADGSLAFGPAQFTASGGTYRAVMDYVNTQVWPAEFYVRKVINQNSAVGGLARLQPTDTVRYYEVRAHSLLVTKADSFQAKLMKDSLAYDNVTVPIYIGVGMRLSADIRAVKGGIALTSLASIAARAQDSALAGTLTLQTIGITGKAIATGLPLPSTLDQTTVENAILAIGSARAFLYGSGESASGVVVTPRVVGLYSPIGTDPLLINAIYSALTGIKPVIYAPCRTEIGG